MENIIMSDYTTRKYKVYVVQGKPVPLSRPRLSEHGVYDSQKAVKTRISTELLIQKGSDATICGLLHLHMDFYMQLPKTKTHRNHLIQQKYHVYKPDLSNLIKLIEDVCVDIGIIEDDCLIASITARKLYGDPARTEFYFSSLIKETKYE
jgi:Holliday junction resolvase RusA-like endonuclease